MTSGSEFVSDLKKSAIVSIALMTLTIAFAHTDAGSWLERATYDVIRTRLETTDVPITIVDISSLAARTGVVTPRETLRRAIDAIAGQHPRAIGVDIDFSPDRFGYLDAEDPEFFQRCIDIRQRKGVPIFLGAGRSVLRLDPASRWLGDPQFSSLAAHILLPRSGERMLQRVGNDGRSMSAALADAYLSEESEQPHGLGAPLEPLRIAEKTTARILTKDFAVEEMRIDWGAAETLRRQVFADLNPEVLASRGETPRFENRVVILGDATAAGDDSVVVGSTAYPGVMFHASSAYTLMRGPLYALTTFGHLALDTVCTLFVIAAIAIMRTVYRRRAESLAIARLQMFFTLTILLLPVCIGVFFVRSTRLLWDDFILGVTALLLHPSIETRLEPLRETARKLYERFVFRSTAPQ